MEILGYMFADGQVIALIALVIVLIFCSAFAAAAETSLFSLKPTEVDDMIERGDKRGGQIEKLLDNSEPTLATILILGNLIDISIVILTAKIIAKTINFASTAWELAFTSVVVTFILLLFCELLPKVYANYNNTRFARICAPVVLVLTRVMRPVAWLMVKSSSRIKGRGKDNLSLEQLSDALDVTQAHSEEEKQILEGIVSFAGREVGQIMKSRLDIVALDIEYGFERVKEVIVRSGFSRIPVYEENIDHIAGILYIKDMVPHIAADDGFRWQELLREAYFVPEHKKIDDLLVEFQGNKVHLAIVVDEYGSTQGLVSLEDILEEIVGEISDESDFHTSFYTKVNEGEYIFEGKAHLGDLERALGLEEDIFDDVKGQAETIAGLMLELKRGFLKKGESIESHGIRFTALSHAGRRIEKVKIEVL